MSVGVLVGVLFVILALVVLVVALAVWSNRDTTTQHRVDPYREREELD